MKKSIISLRINGDNCCEILCLLTSLTAFLLRFDLGHYCAILFRAAESVDSFVVLLGEFTKLGKVIASFVMSVRPNMEHGTRLQLDRFSRNLIFKHFSKIC